MTPEPQYREMSPSDMITQKSGVSIAVVTVLLSGVIANVTMMMSMKSDVALIQRDMEHIVRDLDETRSEMIEIRNQIAALSSRVYDLEQ